MYENKAADVFASAALPECQKSRQLSKWNLSQQDILLHFGVAEVEEIFFLAKQEIALLRKAFDLLRNSPLSSIPIHFGVELLVLTAPLTSAFYNLNLKGVLERWTNAPAEKSVGISRKKQRFFAKFY